jgi:hypothetical protein
VAFVVKENENLIPSETVIGPTLENIVRQFDEKTGHRRVF